MSFALRQIPDDIKMGREYALLGNYDTSMVYYDGAYQTIKKQVQRSLNVQRTPYDAPC